MVEQEYHEMLLDSVHPSGAEEWYCPTCGRRFLMQWPPAYNKVILEAGDESAIHSGGKGSGAGDATGCEFHTELPQAEALRPDELEALQPWMEWMERVDFDRYWDRDLQ